MPRRTPIAPAKLAPKISADFVTQSHVELLKRPEVTAAIICTDEHLHVDPIMAAVERGIPMLIEKPLATNLAESERVLKAIKAAKLDAVVGYTQRFRRRWLAAKEKCRTGALGDVTMVTSRAFMNRLVAIDNYKRTDDPTTISPMVISGTHALDICMWCLEARPRSNAMPVRSTRCSAPPSKGIDGTAGMINFSDGAIYHLNMSWALPVTWPAAVYSSKWARRYHGRTHHRRYTPRHCACDLESAGRGLQPRRHAACRFHGQLPARRHGARRITRAYGRGNRTRGSTALRSACPRRLRQWKKRTDLMLTKALDLSAKRKQAVKLPLDPDEVRAAA